MINRQRVALFLEVNNVQYKLTKGDVLCQTMPASGGNFANDRAKAGKARKRAAWHAVANKYECG